MLSEQQAQQASEELSRSRQEAARLQTLALQAKVPRPLSSAILMWTMIMTGTPTG